MAGLIFLRTKEFDKIVKFYKDLGMTTWKQQTGIEILSHGNFLVGFQSSTEIDKDCLLTFFYKDEDGVNGMYSQFKDIATTTPQINTRYNIYNFFATDPEGRKIEFQAFLDDIQQVKIEWLD